ncbi:MAG: hypothetical protein KJ069_17245 [Anaerolineae bacterium]|nr:hypothetical protein [Anaerolineae bacterium]
MEIGPVQVIVFGFDRTDQFRGEILAELLRLRGRGLIRLIDAFVAMKTPAGEIAAMETQDLTNEESVAYGRVVSKLLGIDGVTTGDVVAAAVDRTMAAAAASLGLDYQGLRQTVENLPPGKAFGVLMFEHTWAISLAAAIRRAGGVPLAQGFVTPESLVMIGEELNAIAEAAATIERAQIVQSAAILDTLATLQQAEAIKTAVAADVVRTLAMAELIEETAVAEAIETLAAVGLLEAELLETAVQDEAKKAAKEKGF